MLTVEVAPAQWAKESGLYIVKRMGYILFTFFELTNEMRVEGSSKKAFVVTAKNVDTILDIDTRSKYSEADSNEELMLYKPQNSPLVTIMKIERNEDRSYNFTYCEMSEDDAQNDGQEEADVKSFNEITLRPG